MLEICSGKPESRGAPVFELKIFGLREMMIKFC